MILVCVSKELSFGTEAGTNLTLLPFVPAPREDGNLVLDPGRVYLALEETVQALTGVTMQQGLPQPIRLAGGILDQLPQRPQPLAEMLHNPPKRQVRICLINGGGGGLGDGILSAPAFKVLGQRLHAATGAEPILVAYSMLPQRTKAVLAGVPGLEVRPMPLSLAEFMEYDAVADLSGMLDDPAFHRSHMTDFVLARLGIDPTEVPDAEKAPFLHLPKEVPDEVARGLGRAYAVAAGKPLVAVIFLSSYTRSLPEDKAARLVRLLAGANCQPVLLFPEGHSVEAFMARHELHGVAVDCSAASRTFLDYFLLLAGMDGIVTVDTSAVHVGAALRKPTVALFNSIRMEYRIRYSPTVHGIQMAYRGRTCQAPCGLSKSRAFIQGQLPDGKPFRLECGYACDEAVERAAILEEAGTAIDRIDPAADVATAYEAIRQRAVARLHAHLAPCWGSLDEEEVVRGLIAMMEADPEEAAMSREVVHVGAE
jgi:ADP-heptose:LPS heptosyltransferase